MKIERVRINQKSYYFVDGVKINSDALSTILKGIYGGDVCCKMYREVCSDGFAILEKYVGSSNKQLIEQLERANEKIIVLKKKVAELTIKNLYSEMQTA